MTDLRSIQLTAANAKANAFEAYAIGRRRLHISEEIAMAVKSEKLAWDAWNNACEEAEKTHDAIVINDVSVLEVIWQKAIDKLMFLEDKAALI